MFIAALFTITKAWKQPKCPSTDEWIKKRWGVCVCVDAYIHSYIVEYYSAMKKNEILPFVTTWMDLEGIMLSEISQMQKDKFHMVSFLCGMKQTNKEANRQTKKAKISEQTKPNKSKHVGSEN